MNVAPVRGGAALGVTLLIQVAATAATMAPTVAAPQWLPGLGLPVAVVGLYVSVVYGCAMLSSQWGAALVARFGPVRTSQFALAGCAAGLALMARGHPLLLGLGAVLLGAAYGWVSPASADILARSTAPRHYALMFSLRQTGIPLGGAVAGLLVPVAVGASGPALAMGLAAALCLFSLLAAQPLRAAMDAHRAPAGATARRGAFTQPMRFLLGDPVLRRLAWCSLLLAAVQMSLTSYLVTFLNTELRWTLVAAGLVLAALQVTGAAGRVLWGALADRRLGDLRMLILLAATAGLLSPWMAWLTPASPPAAVAGLVIVFGSATLGWSGVLTGALARQAGPSQAALVTSGSLFFTYLGVVIGPPLFGLASAWLHGFGPAFAGLALPMAATVWLLWRAHRR